jgi:hypothetical protein
MLFLIKTKVLLPQTYQPSDINKNVDIKFIACELVIVISISAILLTNITNKPFITTKVTYNNKH